jgi:hypothetical protein
MSIGSTRYSPDSVHLRDRTDFLEDLFLQHREGFLPKLKVCLLSVSSTNLSAQNSKQENNALDNTSLLLMYRRYNLLFYSQFNCAIARFLFSDISFSFHLAFSMYFLSSEDGLNDLSMSIGSTSRIKS